MTSLMERCIFSHTSYWNLTISRMLKKARGWPCKRFLRVSPNQ